jgi:hypothetical protein
MSVSEQVVGVLRRHNAPDVGSIAISLAGYLNQQQQEVIDYLQEEKRVLREQNSAASDCA